MKKAIYIGITAIIGIISLESFTGSSYFGKREDGTEPGHTGSPGDSLKNCTICHGGTTELAIGWITSNIPESGYEPGKRYTITATNSVHGATRFGFQVSPQAINGTLLGTLIITDTTTTQLVGSSKYVTYRAAGVEGQDSRSWSFDWIAPEKGTGEVIFYGAFNSNPGHKDKDKTFLSQLKVEENISSGLHDINSNVKFAVHPNPAKQLTNVTLELSTISNVNIKVVDIAGKEVMNVLNGMYNGLINQAINTDKLANGTYYIHTKVNQQVGVQKLLVAH
jgi:hypothetical protein